MNIPAQGGSYRVRATARGGNGREPEGTSSLWVSGGNWDFESVENPSVPIITDKKTYAAGEVAKLLIAEAKPIRPLYVTIEGRNIAAEYKGPSNRRIPTVSFDLPLAVHR